MKKLYLYLIVILLLGGGQSLYAQDSSVCSAAFQATISANSVNFRAMDSMPGVLHSWNFGDGVSETTDSISVFHVYAADGSYTVTQVVTDSAHHCRDSSAQVITINTTSCNVTIQYSNDTVNHLFHFQAIPVFSGGSAFTITWTINDSVAGTGDTLTSHLVNGPYRVCANLSVNSGCNAQACVTVDSTITPPPPPDTCTINFTAQQRDHKPNQYVFTVIDSKAYDSISWTVMGPDSLFAGPFHGASFKYTFPDTGLYTIIVTAEKRTGCAVSNGQFIHIDSVPAPSGRYIAAYPNPASTQVSVNVTLDSYSTIDVRIYNSMGGQVSSRRVSGYSGNNQITMPVANLPMGVYYIEVQYGETILRSKFQKL